MWLKNIARICTLLFLFMLPFSAGAASFAGKFMPGTSYYYENFDPEQRPWEPGQVLNYEEVFKNYQYYEVLPEQDGSEITVNHFIRGDKVSSGKYRLLPDGSIRKK